MSDPRSKLPQWAQDDIKNRGQYRRPNPTPTPTPVPSVWERVLNMFGSDGPQEKPVDKDAAKEVEDSFKRSVKPW